MQTFTNHLLFHPPKHDITCKFRVDSRNCMLRSITGDDIHCHLVCPWDKHTTLQEHACTRQILLFFHGNNEDVSACMSYCQWLADDLKINVLCCDYPGYGFSSGTPTEDGMNSAAFAVVDFATTKLNYRLQDTIIMGKSIGSTPAIHIAGMCLYQNLGGLILVSAVASAVRCFSGSSRLPSWLLSEMDAWMLPNIKHICNVSCPVQFIHGTEDTVVPYKNSCDLISAMHTPQCTQPFFVKAGHNDIESLHSKKFLETLKAFISMCASRVSAYDSPTTDKNMTTFFEI